MKIALLGYGRQGKKHAHFWRLVGVELDIFTRSGNEGSLKIGAFVPKKYSIIVCAVYPLDEQTLLLQKILDSGYKGYLIIEKPITLDNNFLRVLGERERTIFFIDEAYLGIKIDFNIEQIFEIRTSSVVSNGKFSIQEHAIGIVLRSEKLYLDYQSIMTSHMHTEKEYFMIRTNKYVFESSNRKCFLNSHLIPSSFDKNYRYLLGNMNNSPMLKNIKMNYIAFRNNFFI